jgi:uncharacterized RDD family membrane protein YckC
MPVANEAPGQTPNLSRRLLCMVYEALLLFGVCFVAILIYSLIAHFVFGQAANSTEHQWLMQIYLFLVIGVYFCYAWRKGGQTLAMKTWGLQLIDPERAQLPIAKVIVRYCLAWMWFLPGFLVATLLHFSMKNTALAVAINMLVWMMTAVLSEDKQIFHDKLAKTKLIFRPQNPTQTN